jgi:DNA-binding NarL/FixJ family response regulator
VKTRILIADDHAILRRGLADLLQDEPDLTVVGEARDGQEALEMALCLRPDIVLMDITMPAVDGIEATRRIGEAAPEIRVIGLSMYEEEDMAAVMMAMGAVAYLTKTAPIDELLSTLRRYARPR